MKRIIIALVILSAACINLTAVFNDYEPSPRARALSGAFYSTSDDAFAVFYNPAGLIRSGKNIAMSYTHRYGSDFSILSSVAVSWDLPKKFGTVGLGLMAHDVDYLDVNLMSEKTYTLSHGIILMKDIHSEIAFGYSLNLYHLSISGFGEQPSFGLNLGAIAVLHQRTRIGFAVNNINNPKLGEDNRHDLPQKMSIGIAYEPYQNITTIFELRKSVDDDTEIHTGAEVTVFDILALRFGVRNNPASYSAGAGFQIYDIIVDYGFNTHSTLSGTHHIGLGYKF
jgi:hypothetical protein